MGLTDDQISSLVLIERVSACLSVGGTLAIIATFLCFKELRTLSNTLIFYASFANLGADIACLIGYFGIIEGPSSPLCQFQGFLLEMYVSDPVASA
jgi:hypothetical protein